MNLQFSKPRQTQNIHFIHYLLLKIKFHGNTRKEIPSENTAGENMLILIENTEKNS